MKNDAAERIAAARARLAELIGSGQFVVRDGFVACTTCHSTFHNMRGATLVEALEAHQS